MQIEYTRNSTGAHTEIRYPDENGVLLYSRMAGHIPAHIAANWILLNRKNDRGSK